MWGRALLAFVVSGCVMQGEGRPEEAWVREEVEALSTKDEVAAAAADGVQAWDEDICALQGWYEDDECDWFCPYEDAVCDVPPLGPEPVGRATRYPIVLVHGFMSDRTGFLDGERLLAQDGHAVMAAEVPPLAPIEVRAEYLAAWIDHALQVHGADKVNIVAHSMGGLDARYVIWGLGYGDVVASVTTIGTPHWGSRVADVAAGLVEGDAWWWKGIRDGLMGLIEGHFDTYDEVEDLEGAILDLTTDEAAFFNEMVRDDARVHYISWAGVSSKIAKWPSATEDWCGDVLAPSRGWLGFGADLMDAKLAPLSLVAGGVNDGVVRVDSAAWGDFHGCIPADHGDEVQMGAGPQRITGYDAARFIRNHAFALAKEGY
jgi:triacylglycerol lipase